MKEGGSTRRSVRLLIVTGATGHERDGTVYLPAEQVERFRALPHRFDTTLVIKRTPARSGAMTALPPDVRVVWIEPYRSKWHLLTPRHFLSLWGEVRDARCVIALMPLLDGIAPLMLAFVARRPRYAYVIASSIHLRRGARGGAFVRRVAQVLVNACALVSTRVFVNGIGLAEELWGPLRGKTTEVILSTLSPDDFMDPDRDAGTRLEILTVCRLVPAKRVDVALEMMRILLDRGVGARLTVVGAGPLRDGLVDLARSRSLGDRVVFTGFVDDRRRLRELYRRSHVFVLPTEMEGVSLAIQEAMAAGLAVVSTDAGALARFLEDGVDSIVVHRPDPIGFADAVGRLASSRGLRLEIARGGQRKASGLGNAAWVAAVADLIEADLDG